MHPFRMSCLQTNNETACGLRRRRHAVLQTASACTSSSNSAWEWLLSGAGAFALAGFTGDTRPPLPTLAGEGGGTALEDDDARLVDATCMMQWPLSLSKLEPEAAGEIVT